MEPVQRIPRYTLLFREMIKHMAPGDTQRAKLEEVDEIASKIAKADADENTQRAAIVYCLIATIDGFPPNMFSNSRRFIDCIDVEDILLDAPMSSAASSSSLVASLHCTLFLFDDKLLIVKRPGNGEKSGRSLSGLDELDKVTKGGIPTGKKKSGMVCKGVFDVTDIVATDQGGAGTLNLDFIYKSLMAVWQTSIYIWRTLLKTKVTDGLVGHFDPYPSSIHRHQLIWTLHRQRPINYVFWRIFGLFKLNIELG